MSKDVALYVLRTAINGRRDGEHVGVAEPTAQLDPSLVRRRSGPLARGSQPQCVRTAGSVLQKMPADSPAAIVISPRFRSDAFRQAKMFASSIFGRELSDLLPHDRSDPSRPHATVPQVTRRINFVTDNTIHGEPAKTHPGARHWPPL